MSYAIFESKIDYDKAREIVGERNHKDWKDNITMYKGDHWGQSQGRRDGRFWSGPHADSHPQWSAHVRNEIKRLFVSRNVIKEIIDRHISGVQAHWRFTVARPLADGEVPTEEELSRIREAEALGQAWLEKRNAPNDDDDRDDEGPVQRCLANVLMDGRSLMRLFVPRDKLVPVVDQETLEPTGDNILPEGTIEECLDSIFLHTADPDKSRMWLWKNSQEQIGIYRDEDDDPFNLETRINDNGYAELTYLDPDQNTVLRIVGENSRIDGRVTLGLGGKLTMHEVRRPILITEQVRSIQKSLNMAFTMMSRNVVMAGFVERTLLNGQLPGEWKKDDKTNEEFFVPQPVQLGAASINQFAGLEYTARQEPDGTTVKNVTEPKLVYRDPSPVQIFKDTIDLLYASMLQETNQLHYLLSDKAQSSGEARKQALAAFVMDLDKTIIAINRLYRWLVETALTMAAFFAGQPDYFADLRVDAHCTVDVGRLSAEDLRIISDLVERGHLSLETGMTWMGLVDTAAEMERIEREHQATEEQEPDMDGVADEINRILQGDQPLDEDEEDEEDEEKGEEDGEDRQNTVQQQRQQRLRSRRNGQLTT